MRKIPADKAIRVVVSLGAILALQLMVIGWADTRKRRRA